MPTARRVSLGRFLLLHSFVWVCAVDAAFCSCHPK